MSPRCRRRAGAPTRAGGVTVLGGTWRICCVVDYASKYVLAAHISATAKARDAVCALRPAIARAEALLCHSLLGDCVDLASGEVARLRVVTDDGAAFKSDSFWRFVTSHPCLEHIRTRHYAPEANGVVERFNRSLKYEHLYQREIVNGPSSRRRSRFSSSCSTRSGRMSRSDGVDRTACIAEITTHLGPRLSKKADTVCRCTNTRSLR